MEEAGSLNAKAALVPQHGQCHPLSPAVHFKKWHRRYLETQFDLVDLRISGQPHLTSSCIAGSCGIREEQHRHRLTVKFGFTPCGGTHTAAEAPAILVRKAFQCNKSWQGLCESGESGPFADSTSASWQGCCRLQQGIGVFRKRPTGSSFCELTN